MTEPTTDEPRTESRRRVLKAAAMGGAALWVEPTVLALDTQPAAATTCAGATQRGLLSFGTATGDNGWTRTTVSGSFATSASDVFGVVTTGWWGIPNGTAAFALSQNATSNNSVATYCRNVVVCAGVNYRFWFYLTGVGSNTFPQTFQFLIAGTARTLNGWQVTTAGGLPAAPPASIGTLPGAGTTTLDSDALFTGAGRANGSRYYVYADYTPASNATVALCYRHSIATAFSGSNVCDDIGETAPTLTVL